MNIVTRLIVVAVTSILALTSCSSSDSSKNRLPNFAFVTNGVASFWVIAEAGARAAGKDLKVDVSVHMPAQGIGDQKRIVEDLLTRGTDGIAISPIDPENQAGLINKATKRTTVITQDSDAPMSDRTLYIGMDNYLAGRMAGELVKEALPEGGKVAIFIGRLEQDNARRRRQGVIDELLGRSHDPKRYDAPGTELTSDLYTIAGTLTDQFDRAKAKANVEDMLARHPDVNAMVGLFAYNPPIALEVLKQTGKADSVKVIGFDEADETLKAIQDGTCYGTVVQNPYEYGYRSITILNELKKGNTDIIPANKFINIPARKIKADTVTAFWDDLQKKMAKTSNESKTAAS